MTAALDSRANPKEPYGPASEAHYADPGYQSDGKKRYPLDSEEHCRAAWSYVNMPKNAAMYSAEHLAQIKSRIRAAGKKYGIEFASDDRSDNADSEYRRIIPAVCVRSFDFETRAVADDGRTLEGYVAVFGQVARISDRNGDFDEEIHRGAFDRSLRTGMPVMQFEHGRDPRVGALPIGVYDMFEPDERGYRVRGRLLDDPVVDPIRKAIAAKAIKGMSWRMQVPDSGQKWTRSRYGQPAVDKRDVVDADVPEAGPVVFPAYSATTVSVRSMLAAMDDDEVRSLVHELAAHLGLAVDLTDFTGRSGARSSDGGEPDANTQERSASPATPARPHLRQRLDEGALRLRGILQ